MQNMFKTVYFEISGICNAHCKWCATGRSNLDRHMNTQPSSFISPSDFERAICYLKFNKLIFSDVVFALYNWGEPLLHPSLNEIVNILNSYNMRYSLSTNASAYRPYDGDIDFSNLDSIIISMPGFSQKSYDRIHGFNFESIKTNIVRMLSYLRHNGFHGNALISYHLYQFSLSEIDDVLQFCRENGILLIPNYAYFASMSLYKEYLELHMDQKILREASQDLFLFYLDDHIKERPIEYACPQISEVLAIDEFCNVLTCCCIEKGHQDYSFGKLFEMTADEIYMKKRSQDFCTECQRLSLDWLFNCSYPVTRLGSSELHNYEARDDNGQSLQCLMCIDSPVANECVSNNTFLVRGWCVDGVGVKHIDILLDGVYHGKAQKGFFRPEVQSTFPMYLNPYSGFEYIMDLSNTHDGKHIISIVCYNKNDDFMKSSEIVFHLSKNID